MEDGDEVTADIASVDATGDEPSTTDGAPDSAVVRVAFIAAVVFLVVAAGAVALAALQLVWPDLGAGIPYLSYGRLIPVGTTLFLYGWLTIGLMGAAFHIVPSVTGIALRARPAANAAIGLTTVGVIAGATGIGLGMNEGRPLLEMPLWADAVVFLGLLLAALSITTTAAAGRERLGPPVWYFVAGSWWVALAWVAGNVPGMGGYGGVIQSSFYRAAVTGLWFAASGVAIAYYLIPRLTGSDPSRSSRLAALGFWSLAIAWVGTAARDLVYGAGPDWFETLGIAFSIALIVPVLAIVADLAIAMRGRWDRVADRVVLRFVIAGAFLFLLVPFADLLQALRSSSAVVQYTSWVAGNDHLVFTGAVSFWLFAIAYHALAGAGPVVRQATATWHFRYSIVGLGLALAAMWMGGLVSGFTWAAGANDALPTSFGEGFYNTTVGQEPYVVAAAVGLSVFALAQLLLAAAAFRRAEAEEVAASDAGDDDEIVLLFGGPQPRMGWRSLRVGAVALFAVAAIFGWMLPAIDPDNSDATILADDGRTYPEGSAVAEGRAVYLAEGCWYCHTQEVRAIVTDVGLGPVSVAGDYANESPVLRGGQRVGPDLMHTGSREGSSSYRFVFAHLQDPRVARSWSNMPSYTYLSEHDLDVLTQYVVGLR